MAARKGSSGTRQSGAKSAGGGKRKESAPNSRDKPAEYQTAQEEMRAANEELRIANEELETAGETLRSSNDQLSRLNSELQQRNREWEVLTNDLSNLLDGVDIPVLVLDGDLRIRRFTAVAGMLLNLMPGDVGRPFSDLASAFSHIEWGELFSEVSNCDRLVEREVQDRNGRHYSLRLRPYKSAANEIDGVLLVLFDTDAIQRARDLAQDAERLNDFILNSMAANVAVLNATGLIVKTNEAWSRFARENGDPPLTTIGPSANYLAVCERAANAGDGAAQQALDGVRSVLNGHSTSFRMEYPCHSANEQRWFVMNVSPFKGTRGGAVITHTNVSDRKLAEVAAQTSESMIGALLASAPQSVIAVDDDKKIVFVNGNVDKMFGYTPEHLLGKSLDILIPEDARARHEEHHKIYFANMQTRPMGIGLELEARRKDGTQFPVEIGLGAIKTEAGKLAVAFVSDITERRRMEGGGAGPRAGNCTRWRPASDGAGGGATKGIARVTRSDLPTVGFFGHRYGGLAVEAPLPPDLQGRLKALQSRWSRRRKKRAISRMSCTLRCLTIWVWWLHCEI